MKNCPKCNTPNEVDALICIRCRESFDVDSDKSGTLDIHKIQSDSFDPAEGAAESDSKTVSPSSLADLQAAELTDESKTIPVDSNSKSSVREEKTIVRSDESKTHVSSAGSELGSTGRIQKAWDAAIGSSGNDSKKSLRYQPAEASDSVFHRIASRSLLVANSEGAEGADYQIRDKIGEGGMGIVYSAIQSAINRTVAIKIAKPDAVKSESSRRQFFYEAAITADLDHPNIPPIYELAVSSDGVPFYSLKLIVGTEWEAVIGQKSLAENIEIWNRVSEAVSFAHSKNIIHRDLKPENVMVGKFGEVYLTDWGLAVDIAARPKVMFGGTPDYMAPEMANDRRKEIGKHSDVYLLGAVLFQILTGRPPHFGKTQKERLELAAENAIAETDCKDPLLEVALKAMCTRPEDRYKGVAAMQSAVREILKHNDSIELSQRSSELLSEAVASKNYDLFNRAIFGFRDSIDLWSDNKTAKSGLQEARLAYGQCALDQGNYELALQTLDEKVPGEAPLYAKAKSAKLAAEGREARYRRFRTAAFGVLSLLSILLSGALAYAIWSGKELEAATKRTIAQSEKARQAEKDKNDALANENKALLEAETERKSREEAERKARDQKAKDDELLAQSEAEKIATREKLLMAEAQAEKERADAERQRADDAIKASAKINLASVPRLFNLAVSQIRQFDIQSVANLARQISETKLENLPDGKAPSFQNWAFQRVSLLANVDLPKQSLGGPVTAIDFAPDANVGIAGNAMGDVVLLQVEKGKLVEKGIKKSLGANVRAAVISPKGNQAFVATETRRSVDGKDVVAHELYDWDLEGGGEPTRITDTQNRAFQRLLYSPDGSMAIAGNNQGLWIKRTGEAWRRLSTSEDADIRGEIVDLTWVNPTQVLVLASLNKTKFLHLADISTGKMVRLEIPAKAIEAMTAIASLSDGRVLVGNREGTLYLYDFNAGTLSGGLEVRPRRHQSAIEEIRVISGRVLTRSLEPTAHVWLVGSDGGLEYETFVTGAPGETTEDNNVASVAFLDRSNIVSVDSLGNAVAMNIDRQEQRRRLVLRSQPGLLSPSSPVIGIHAIGDSSTAAAVDRNGVVDLWNLQTGIATKAKERFAYFGHTPGAVLVDSQVDRELEVVITAANLRNALRVYLSDQTHMHEYCFWDLKTGNMLKRWAEPANPDSSPRISLLGTGLLMSSSEDTKIVDYSSLKQGGELSFPKASDAVAASRAFTVGNPKSPELSAVIAPTGALFLWDRRQDWDGSGLVRIGLRGELPLQAVWSSDGNRFYVVVSTGRIFRSRLVDGKFQSPQYVESVRSGSASLLNSHHAIDLIVESKGGTDRVLCATRDPGLTSFLECDVSEDGTIARATRESHPGAAWLDSQSGGVVTRFGEKSISESQKNSILSASRIGRQFFVTTKREGVYSISDNTADLLGQLDVVGSASDREGKKVWLLRADGALTIYDVSSGVWLKAEFAFPEAKRLVISPDGSQLAVQMSDSYRIVNAKDGSRVLDLSGVLEFAWDPNGEGRFGAITSKGEVLLQGNEQPLAKLNLADSKALSVHFYDERWSDPAIAPTRYLLVQTEQSGNKAMATFVPLERGEVVAEERLFEAELPLGCRLAVSPKDSLLATGGQTGAVRIWFASPTYEKLDALFDLETESDSPISEIAFADQGDTLVCADEKGRLTGWLSKDKLTSTDAGK